MILKMTSRLLLCCTSEQQQQDRPRIGRAGRISGHQRPGMRRVEGNSNSASQKLGSEFGKVLRLDNSENSTREASNKEGCRWGYR